MKVRNTLQDGKINVCPLYPDPILPYAAFSKMKQLTQCLKLKSNLHDGPFFKSSQSFDPRSHSRWHGLEQSSEAQALSRRGIMGTEGETQVGQQLAAGGAGSKRNKEILSRGLGGRSRARKGSGLTDCCFLCCMTGKRLEHVDGHLKDNQKHNLP